MNIELTIKDIKELGHLRNALASNMVPTKELESFLDRLQQKIEKPAATKIRKPSKFRMMVDESRRKLRSA